MFDALSDKLQKTFRNLRGLGKISETNVSEALREVRMALLDADVNFKVAKQFIARVKEKSLGEEVVASIQPGQQIVKSSAMRWSRCSAPSAANSTCRAASHSRSA
jgi:signal recognition particle subunit SRP54